MKKLGVGCEIEKNRGADYENSKDRDDLLQNIYGQVEELFVLFLLSVDGDYSSSIKQLYQILNLCQAYNYEKETKWLIDSVVTRVVLQTRNLEKEI